MRAFCSRLLSNDMPAVCAIWFHTFCTGAAPQNRPMSVWSALLVVLLISPSDLISSKSVVERGLVTAGGGGGRNWSPVSSANGRTSGQFVKTGCLKLGGVSWYSPGPDCRTNTGGVLSDPSSASAARMALAASFPTRIPCQTCAPPPIWDRESWNFASITDCWFGKRDSRAVCAAAAAAASGDTLRGACKTRYGACPPLIAFTAS